MQIILQASDAQHRGVLAAQAFVNVSDATDEKQEGSEEGKR